MNSAEDNDRELGIELPEDFDPEALERNPDEALSAVEEFYQSEHLPDPLEPLTLVLDAGKGIDWGAARRSIDSIDADDLDYIFFVLAISEDTAGGVANALSQARELLHSELDLLAAAVRDPDNSELEVVGMADGSLVLCAPAPQDGALDPTGVYGAILRLGLMYVTEPANLRRNQSSQGEQTEATALDTPARLPRTPRHRMAPRTRDDCPNSPASRRRRPFTA